MKKFCLRTSLVIEFLRLFVAVHLMQFEKEMNLSYEVDDKVELSIYNRLVFMIFLVYICSKYGVFLNQVIILIFKHRTSDCGAFAWGKK